MKLKKYNKAISYALLLVVGFYLGNYSDLIGNKLSDSINAVTNYVASSSDASSSNSSESNASASDASNSNASDSNSSSSNSSSSNVPEPSDNFLILNSFVLGSSSAYAGDRVPVDIQTTGASYGAVYVTFKDSSNLTFTASIGYSDKGDGSKELILPNDVTPSDYEVSSITFTAYNSDGSTFTVTYDENSKLAESLSNYQGKIHIDIKMDKKIKLLSFFVENKEVNAGDKVKFYYTTDIKPAKLRLDFVGDTGDSISIYVPSNESYFQIPQTLAPGNYELQFVRILDEDSNLTIYTNQSNVTIAGAEYFDFNTIINVKLPSDVEVDNNKNLSYDNNDIKNEQISNIYKADDKAEITINATDNSVIKSDIFNAIKGTNKKLIINYKTEQIIFNGMDITQIKAIDVSILKQLVSNDNDIKNLITNGVVLNFANNGVLPGKALVRIKNDQMLTKELSKSVINAYYYNEQTKKFTLVAEKIKLTSDGYYEFNITHNSKYILTKEKIDSKLVTVDNTAAFKKSSKSYFVIITAILTLAAISYIFVTILNQKGIIKKKEESEIL